MKKVWLDGASDLCILACFEKKRSSHLVNTTMIFLFYSGGRMCVYVFTTFLPSVFFILLFFFSTYGKCMVVRIKRDV